MISEQGRFEVVEGGRVFRHLNELTAEDRRSIFDRFDRLDVSFRKIARGACIFEDDAQTVIRESYRALILKERREGFILGRRSLLTPNPPAAGRRAA